MKHLPFKPSEQASLGVELELQVINAVSFGLISKAKELLRSVSAGKYVERLKPEITQSMIEINSSIHHSTKTLHHELLDIQRYLLEQADMLDFRICGGGTHPFEKWPLLKIFPTNRFKRLSRYFIVASNPKTNQFNA